MPTIFEYPRSLLNRENRATAHLTPPFWLGPMPSRKIANLEALLSGHLDKFSNSRQLSSDCKIHIDLSRDGTRQVFTGRRYWQTAIFPSRKCGKPVVCEGPNELLFTPQCEVDAGIIEYASQPVLFDVRVGSSWRKYHCDFCRLRADGKIEIIEVKPNAGHLEKPDYRYKIDAVRNACALLGWIFTPVFGEDLQKRTYHNFHVNWVHRYRFYQIGDADQIAINRLNSRGGHDVSIGDLVEACSGLVQARATLSALVCWGRAHLDLSQPISIDTPITLIDGGSHAS
jgi:hypothetical protein